MDQVNFLNSPLWRGIPTPQHKLTISQDRYPVELNWPRQGGYLPLEGVIPEIQRSGINSTTIFGLLFELHDKA